MVERFFIKMYEPMGVRTDDRSTETIIFDQGVRKYVSVTKITIFDQVYVTDHNFIINDRIREGY